MKSQKNIISRLKLVLIWTISSFLLLEIILRLLGYQPLQIPYNFIQSTPQQCIAADSILGFDLVPGSYEITINKHLSYHVNHNQDHTRVTYDKKSSNLKKIYSYGCSYTYGMGVDDHESYPYLMDKILSKYKVYNKAAPGFGTVQSYISLQNTIRDGNIPDIIILSYFLFHDERNILNRAYRKKIHMGMLSNKKEYIEKNKLSPWNFPFYNTNNKTIDYIRALDIYYGFPFREKSALMNLIEVRYNELTNNEAKAKEASYEILRKMAKLCKENNIKFYLVYMDQESKSIEKLCTEENIEFINSFIDLNQEGYRNRPYDQHPSPIAHREYAQLILNHLEKDSIY